MLAFCLNTLSLQVFEHSGVLAIQRNLADSHAEDRSTSDFEESRTKDYMEMHATNSQRNWILLGTVAAGVR